MRIIWNLDELLLRDVAVPHFEARPDGRLVAQGPLTREALLEAAQVVAGGELTELHYGLYTRAPAPAEAEGQGSGSGQDEGASEAIPDDDAAVQRHPLRWPSGDDYLLRYLRFLYGQTHGAEALVVIFYGLRGHAIEIAEVSRGDRRRTPGCQREIVRRALQLERCSSLVLTHNHPDGSPYPSDADIAYTLELRQALRLVDVELADHVILGDAEYASMSALGLLDEAAPARAA